MSGPAETIASPAARRPKRDRLYIFPTRYGLFFILVLLGMLIGSVNYNNNLAFLLTFLLTGMAFASMLHTHRNLKNVEISAGRVEPVFAGEAARVELSVRAPGRDRAAVELSLQGGEAVTTDLTVGQGHRVTLLWPTDRRGLHRPGRLLIQTRYPFGLFRAWTRKESGAEVLAYPRPASGETELIFASGGDGQGRASGSGVDDFRELRAYRPGDPFPRIAWKASSRGHGLMTREFEATAGASAVLDWEALDHGGTEERLSRLCAMLLKADMLDIDFGLNLPGRMIGPGRGPAHRRQCLRALALFRLPEGGPDGR